MRCVQDCGCLAVGALGWRNLYSWIGVCIWLQVTGHMFAYQIFSSIATNATYKKEAE